MSDAHRSEMERAADRAVAAIEAARSTGTQLGLFEELRPVETRKRSGNRASSALSGWLAEQGYGSPAEALIRHAGLHLGGASELKAMATVDMIEQWACRGEVDEAASPLRFTPGMRAGLYGTVLSEMRRAAEALMPYVAKKLTPDVAVSTTQQLVIGLPAGSSGAPGPYAPPPMPEKKVIENQQLSAEQIGHSDNQTLTTPEKPGTEGQS